MSILASLRVHGTLTKIYFCTVITFCSLYAAQPIQPVFQHEFALTSFQAILFTTLMMLPLGFAPLFYGVLLESLSARLIVRTAILLLGVLATLAGMLVGLVVGAAMVPIALRLGWIDQVGPY